ncbi:hypothetical protein SUGI_0810350 [Cryptomeria japonica]|uniref:protein unc-13 homolog n=1 Tax=Cryptomeria japonica TaxID=3369 RepID=UPI002414B1B0|nr:protein unc-13 homolog [Cryptomeria japonica]XP_057834235.2 protein unc-13 homolog [Cryptomeria japonica]XP_057834236.2 protein unc-13 homolog [Cryptomeria japonica]GLJ39640.1 hypothetical protein SUGI_0810350 [Cryptomeria japonica]
MEEPTNLELLQRFRRDRHELLCFLLSASLVKKVVMPPGAVSLDDVDLDQVSVDYVLECTKKGGVLELSEAIKAYYDELNVPPGVGSGSGKAYFLVTTPESSGPPPPRVPPQISNNESLASSASLSKTYSLRSAPSQQLSVDDEIDDFEDEEEDDGSMEYTSRRRLNDASDLLLALPSFKTGLLDDDLRETAYEVLLAAAGASGGLILPTKEKKKEKKSKLMRKLTRSKGEKTQPQPQQALGLSGLLDIMRIQMEISEAVDVRTREGLIHAAAGRVGKRMDSLLIPLELLCTTSQTDFSDKKSYLRWQKRQLNMLEEGLLNHPAVRIDASERMVTELRALLMKIEEAEGLPSPASVTQRTESLKAMREVALALAERPARGDITGEVCHWADGYHLNVRLYEKLLHSIFDTLDEGKLVEELEEILELLKSSWRILGITQTIHDTCYTWVLFRQFVLTGESDLLQHATQHMKRIAFDGQRSTQERLYMRNLRCSLDNIDGYKELTFVQSVLIPIKQWTDKRLVDYHKNFPEGSSIMEGIVTAAMVAGRLIAGESDQTGVMRMTSTAEMAAVSKQTEDYILSSIKAAYERVLESVDSKSEAAHEHPLAVLAEDVKALAKRESTIYAPILSRWNPLSTAVSVSLLHNLYGKELKPFLDGVSHLTEDVASVLPAADTLEQCLVELLSSVCKDGDADSHYKQQMPPYQIENISGTLIMRWINTQLGRISEWVERAIQQEKWESSSQHRNGNSIVEVYRIMEEVVEQFFSLKLPMRIPQLNGLLSGLDNALQAYTQKVVGQIGAKGDLIPPTPILTRYKKETGIKAFTKKKLLDPRLPDDRRSSQINVLSTAKLCVRLNSLHYAVAQLNRLEDSIRERWEQRRLHNNVSSGRSSDDSDLKQRRVIANRPADVFSTAFDGTRKAVNAAIDKICEFTGIKIIFWDMKGSFIDGLYKDSVSQARMETVVHSLDSVLVQLCDVIVDPLRDRVVIGLLQASLDGLARVLLDGGPSRVFSQADAKLVEEDLQILKEFFMAGGDGIPRGVVENAAALVQQILKLYSLETHAVIENMRHASEQMATGSNAHRNGNKTANDADTILRVLCHRSDSEASNFLKKQYKLPKSAG